MKKTQETFNWQDYQDRLGTWSDSVFGDDRFFNAAGTANHLLEEVQELKESPNDLSEYADCIMLILDYARLNGIGVGSLAEACEKKLEVNKKRKWKKVEAGYYKHI